MRLSTSIRDVQEEQQADQKARIIHTQESRN